MARIDRVLQIVALLLALLGLVAGIDLFWAISAEPCPAPDCYPWGAEGPAGEYWRYRSKMHYVASGLALFALPTAASLVSLTSDSAKPQSVARRSIVLALLGVTIGLIVFG